MFGESAGEEDVRSESIADDQDPQGVVRGGTSRCRSGVNIDLPGLAFALDIPCPDRPRLPAQQSLSLFSPLPQIHLDRLFDLPLHLGAKKFYP